MVEQIQNSDGQPRHLSLHTGLEAPLADLKWQSITSNILKYLFMYNLGSALGCYMQMASEWGWPVMDSVIPTVSDRDTRAEAERGIKQELEASLFTDGIRFSARPHAPVGIYSPRRKGEDGDDD